MAKVIYFTDEQKRRANEVDLEQLLRSRGEKLLPSGRDKRLGSDKSITVRGSGWYDHAAERGGYPIDFMKEYYGMSFQEAVTTLLGGETGAPHPRAEKVKEPEPQHCALPPKNGTMRRVFAYLVGTRNIDSDVVTPFASAETL